MTSLFDRITPRDQPAGTSALAGTGLFGSSIQPSTTATGGSGSSLFGVTQPANNATTNLFANTTQPAQSSGAGMSSLFGGTSQPAQSGTSSLFGGTSRPAQTTTSGGSLFGGGTTATSRPAAGSLFDASAASQAAADNASLFKSGIISQTQDEGKTIAVDVNGAPPNPSYFDTLLLRGKKRQTEEYIGPSGEIPNLQLGLQDISRKVRNLGQGGPSAGLAKGTDARAQYLLSASGVNTSHAARDLGELAASTTVSAEATPAQPDSVYTSAVKETLAQQYQTDFQQMVHTHIQRAHEDFNKMVDERLHGADWDAHRQRIYEHFGLKKPLNLDESFADDAAAPGASSFGRSSRRTRPGASTMGRSFGMPGMRKSVIGTPGPNGARTSQFTDIADKMPVDDFRPAPEDRVLRIKQEKYSERVKELNVARLQETMYPILQKFADVEAEPSNEDTSMLVNAYKALIRITGEETSVDNASGPGHVKERQFAEGYLDDSGNSAMATRLRKRIINGSRRFLEELYYTHVESTITRNPREASVGGMPTAIAKIKAFVRVRASRKELGPDIELLQELNGDYCWPVVFYLLRCGLYDEALDYVDENTAAFRQIDRPFVRYIRAYVTSEDHRLPAEMQTAINNEYSQRIRLAPEDSLDPYRMMCYKVIGRCELQKKNLERISSDVQDWMWLHFALAREYNRIDEFAHEAFGLDELRVIFKDAGDRYFGPGNDVANAPTTRFFISILAGLFEKAIADLYPHTYVSAVHFAIALDFYGMLRVSDVSNSDDFLTFTTRQQPQIAFGSMIGHYTRDFRTANATAAVDYLALICLNGNLTGDLGRRQRELCHQALTEVVLETREFAQLLGDIRSDGQRIKGAIEQRLKLIGLENEQDFLKQITQVAARTAEEQSRTTDAALLFHLAEDYDKVIQVVNEAVSLALTTDVGEQPARLTPLKPRTTEAQQQEPDQAQGSLSLTAIDDPIDLASRMANLYGGNQMYYSKIKSQNSDSLSLLLKLSEARQALEQGAWGLVIDVSIPFLCHKHQTTKSITNNYVLSS